MVQDDVMLDEILAQRRIACVYQPIVDLRSQSVVAYEALARGPAGSPLERPDALFGAAHDAGRLVELDWACREAAAHGAIEAGLPLGSTLFVNVEAATLGHPPPERMVGLVREASERFQIVMEITERALTDRPAELLAAVQQARSLGLAVAVDDVGADPRSLAVMPLLSPDVIKLDLRLVQRRPDAEIASVVNAVVAQIERTGGTVLAEGIETEEHLEAALSMGATLGQGWLFGRPGPLPASGPGASTVGIPLTAEPPSRPPHDPLDIAGPNRPLLRSRKRLLSALSGHLEREAERLPEPSLVLAAVQDARHFGSVLQARYTKLAAHCALVAVLGAGMSDTPAASVRGGRLADDDPLHDVWALAVVGPHFTAALVAADLGDDGPETKRRFDYTLTYDRGVVLDIARSLLQRVSPLASGNSEL